MGVKSVGELSGPPFAEHSFRQICVYICFRELGEYDFIDPRAVLKYLFNMQTMYSYRAGLSFAYQA